MAALKKDLIEWLKNLEGKDTLPAAGRKEIEKTISLLNAKNPANPREDFAIIPENALGKEQVMGFFNLLFTKYPQLKKRPNNVKSLEDYSKENRLLRR